MFQIRRRPPGRRAAPGPVRRFPDLHDIASVRAGLKAVAGASVVGGFAAAVAVPTAPKAPVALALPAALTDEALLVRAPAATDARVSRSAVRVAAPAVSAPKPITVADTGEIGVVGIKAVAKPKPKPVADLEKANAGGFSATAFAAEGASRGLGAHAQAVYSAVRSAFGITNIGGYRSGPGAMDHGTGHACDVMTSNFAQGDAVALFMQTHAAEFDVKYIIWRQRIWFPGKGFNDWRFMADRGSATANHYDHVHISVN